MHLPRLRRAAVEPPPPLPRPRDLSARERRLERALRLARSMIVQQEQADHATIAVIDNALSAED